MSTPDCAGPGCPENATSSPSLPFIICFVLLLVIFVCAVIAYAKLRANGHNAELTILGSYYIGWYNRRTPLDDLEAAQSQRRSHGIQSLQKVAPEQTYGGLKDKSLKVSSPVAYFESIQVCAICLETLENADMIRCLPCGHVYHSNCIKDWYTRCHDNCPLCHMSYVHPKSGNQRA
ncbi:hypothetical protein GQ53DRAFT_768638 [Thozetella sp. PMI_491]|nr:hypothetical protein GQ53DRAFT_768638 [Thozetella sp. PMI_491]